MLELLNLTNLGIDSPLVIVILILSGFLAGIINTIAGTGSILTYSVFIMLGFPASLANGTVRLGVVLQTMASSWYFYKHRLLDIRFGIKIGFPLIAGTLLGANLAVNINEDYFERIVIGVMLLMLLTLFLKPERWIKGRENVSKEKPGFIQIAVYFLIGIYGGFIHIGVGIFLLSALVLLSGFDLVKANALKVFVVFLYSPFALIVFMWNQDVEYVMGSISAAGNLAGGILAGTIAVKKGAEFIRWFLIVIIILFSANLIGGIF